MARPAGLPKTGGRKKGTPNKNTLVILDALDSHSINIVAQLAELLPQLPLEKRVDVLLNLMGYIYPKRRAIEHSGETLDGGPQVILNLPSNGREETPEEAEIRRARVFEKLRILRELDG